MLLKKIIIFKLILILLSFPSMGLADLVKRPSVDASKFDIAGVKLGMDLNLTVKYLSERLNVKPSKMILSQKKYWRERTNRKPFTAQNLTVRVGKDTYTVFFNTNFYNKAPSMIVTQISLKSYDEQKSFKEAVLKKYGTPSYQTKNGGASWCKKPDLRKYSLSPCSSYKGATLSLSGMLGLTLKDNGYLESTRKPKKVIIKKPKTIL